MEMFYVLLNMLSETHAWKLHVWALALCDSFLQGFDMVQIKPVDSPPRPPAAKA